MSIIIMINIPCKECLLRPICKNRDVVRCDELDETAKQAIDMSPESWWGLVNKYLPKTIIILSWS